VTLPTWTKDEHGRWTCDDLDEIGFAQRARFVGFKVPEFDLWAATLPDDEGMRELVERRANAKAARSHDAMMRHLEFMHAQRQYVEHRGEILPLAREGEKTITTRKKAAGTTNAKAKAVHAARNERLAKRARRLIQAGEATPRTVSGVLVEQGQTDGLKVKAVRDILKKAGVR